MGRTVPSYRIASEIEIWKWRPFRRLLDKQDRKIFDEMLSIPRLYNAAGTMACRPVLIQVILISIILEHYKQLSKIINQRIFASIYSLCIYIFHSVNRFIDNRVFIFTLIRRI